MSLDDDLYLTLRRELRQQRQVHSDGVPTDETQPCEWADQFNEKLERLIFGAIMSDPTLGQLAQAKFLLQEEWQAWRRAIPHDHRRDTRVAPHHCVDETYQTAYDRLHTLHLRLHPSVNLITNYDEMIKTEVAAPKKSRKPRQDRVLFAEAE